MKKIMPILIIAAVFILFAPSFDSFAYDDFIVWGYNGVYRWGFPISTNHIVTLRNMDGVYKIPMEGRSERTFTSVSEAVQDALNATNWVNVDTSYYDYDVLVVYGSYFIINRQNLPDSSNIYDSLEDYENAHTSPPTWYKEMWDTLKEELGNPAFWFGEWFIDIIDNIYGDDENDPTGPPKPPLSTHVTIGNPTLAPTPTSIPYSSVIIPKTDITTGDTYYEENYYYINPSGTPIITSTPPTNTPSAGNNSNGTDYTPIGGDPYSIPKVSWLSNVQIGDEDYDGIDSVTDGLGSIDEIGSEYTEGMSAVQDATGTLPTSWILLIGVAAAIPLIAGLISRFLS